METVEKKFEHPEAAAVLDKMMGMWFHYHPPTNVKSANITIANGYHEAIWGFMQWDIEEVKEAPKAVIEEIVKAMLNTGINRAFELILFLRSINKEWAEALVLEVAEAVVSNPHPNSYLKVFWILSEINGLPDTLIKRGMVINQKRGFYLLSPKESKAIIDTLNANLEFWLLEKARRSDGIFHMAKSGIPVFSNTVLGVREQTSKGVLLHILDNEKALLYKGKPVKVPDDVRTVDEAMKAAMLS